MAAPAIAEEFFQVVEKSGLLTPEQLLAFSDRHSFDPTEPAQAAKLLVDDGLLTRFQAERLLEGKWRRLVFDGYKVLDRLGAGGMGWVYIAEEIGTKWKVAIKVLTDKYNEKPGMLPRFKLEAEAGMRLQHPNILRTVALQSTDDTYGTVHYMVMEFIPGINLQELVSFRGTLPWKQSCDFIFQAAKGLHFAHEQGLIHRDVKPENLLIRSNGAVKVLDFGLAMVDENDEEFTMAMIHGQDCLGTADYVSPEQSLNSYKVDRRTDIYSLGCTFYFALTGQVPFPVASVKEKLRGHRQLRPKSVREFNPDIPERVELILKKMMAKHPENRFATGAEVMKYLEPYCERQPVEFDFAALLRARERLAQSRSSARSSNFESKEFDSRASTPVIKPPTDVDQARQDTVVGKGRDTPPF